MDGFIYWSIDWYKLVYLLIEVFIDGLIAIAWLRLIDWLIDWLLDWLIDWLIDWFREPSI